MVSASGGNIPSDFPLSVSSIYRHRSNEREKLALKIKENWISKEKPRFAILHWDSKLITHLSHGKIERVAVLVSGGNQLQAPKLLGIPCATNSTGRSQKEAVMGLITSWSIQYNIIAVVFDTTASNTGVRNGSATLLQEEVERPVLWLACRHHMHKLHIRHVWDLVCGSANSPIEPLLKRFLDKWETFDRSPDNLILFDHNTASEFVYG